MQKRSILRATATAVGGALLVTACNSGSGTTQKPTNSGISAHPVAGSGATNADALDACRYVTTADATALFGQPASESPSAAYRSGACAWNATGNLADGTPVRFSLVAHAYNGTSAYNEPKIPGAHRVANVGTRAYAYTVGATDTIQTVDNDKTVALIYSVRGANGAQAPTIPDKEAKLTALARKAASRL